MPTSRRQRFEKLLPAALFPHIRTSFLRNMDFAQTLAYLYDRLPMFHRIGKAAYKADLGNTIALCNHLGNPQERFRTIHIAGTNGKGSTAHLLAAILQAAGYKTGLYTSPHLKSFTERIRVDGQEMAPEAVTEFINRNRAAIEQINPSFFETTVGMAFDYFARQAVDVAVIEVGLGGRLDSTNIITPDLAVITNISYDHQDILGETLPQIAAEKAGIIKRNIPVVVSEYQPEVAEVFRSTAQSAAAPLVFAAEQYAVRDRGLNGLLRYVDTWRRGSLQFEALTCQLLGEYQFKNIPGVLQSVEILQGLGYTIGEAAIRQAFAQVTTLTGLKGRWQVLNQRPLTICDTGHNEGGIREIVNQLSHLTYSQLFFVLGTVNDKDLSRVLPLLPQDGYYFFCQANIPRALPAADLQWQAAQYGLRGEVVPEVNEALAAARAKAAPEDLIFIGGSTFVVAEINEI